MTEFDQHRTRWVVGEPAGDDYGAKLVVKAAVFSFGHPTTLATNPKIMATLLWWLGGRGEGDGVAERFELADVVALVPVWVEVSGEVVGAEIGECRVVVGE